RLRGGVGGARQDGGPRAEASRTGPARRKRGRVGDARRGLGVAHPRLSAQRSGTSGAGGSRQPGGQSDLGGSAQRGLTSPSTLSTSLRLSQFVEGRRWGPE